MAAAGKLNILPLVVDLARPSPALGWKNAECASFLERARGQFDMVLMLAVLHHLMVTDRVPLEEILNQAAELTTRDLLIEYVDPRDEMFRKIARGRDALHSGLNVSVFRHACERRFRILRSVALNETRHLHLLRRI